MSSPSLRHPDRILRFIGRVNDDTGIDVAYTFVRKIGKSTIDQGNFIGDSTLKIKPYALLDIQFVEETVSFCRLSSSVLTGYFILSCWFQSQDCLAACAINADNPLIDLMISAEEKCQLRFKV